MIKKTTLYLVALSCLGIGFIAGVIFSAVQNVPTAISAQPQEAATGPVPTKQPSDEARQVIARLKQQVAQNPQDYESWVHLGNSYYDSGQAHDAIASYEKALALRDDSADVWTDLGVMYRRHGEPQKAVNCFAEANNRNPQHVSSLYNKGLVLLADLHDRPGAIAAWEQLVAINPKAATPNGKLISDLLAELRHNEKP